MPFGQPYIAGGRSEFGGSGASVLAPKIATFQPDGPDVDLFANVFDTWAQVKSWLTTTPGFKILCVDDRFGVADVPGATGVTDARSLVLLRGIVVESGPGGGNEIPELIIRDDAQLANFALFQTIRIVSDRTAAASPPSLTYDYTADTVQEIHLYDRAVLCSCSAATPNATIESPESFVVRCYDESGLEAGEPNHAPVVLVTDDGTLDVHLYANSFVGEDALDRTDAGMVTVFYDRSSSRNVDLTQNTATVSGMPRLPAVGTRTISDPAGAVVLPENFDNLSTLFVTPFNNADDNLDTITDTAPVEQNRVIVIAKDPADANVITMRNGVGNLLLGSDALLTSVNHRLVLQRQGANWVELSRFCGTRIDLPINVFGDDKWSFSSGNSPGNNNWAVSANYVANGQSNQYTDGTLDISGFLTRIPVGYIPGQPIRLVVRWAPSNANAGDVEWVLRIVRVQIGDNANAGTLAEQSVAVVSAAGGSADVIQETTFNVTPSAPALASGDDVVLILQRDARGANVNDTYSGNANIFTAKPTVVIESEAS